MLGPRSTRITATGSVPSPGVQPGPRTALFGRHLSTFQLARCLARSTGRGTVVDMENFDENVTPVAQESQPTTMARVIASLIVGAVLVAGIFVGGYVALDRTSQIDPITAGELAKATSKSSGTATNGAEVILSSQVKTWHYDTGRIIGPMLNQLSNRPTTPAAYPQFCLTVEARAISLRSASVTPAADVTKAFAAWVDSLDSIKAPCAAKNWSAVDAAVTATAPLFDTFYLTVAKYDSSLLRPTKLGEENTAPESTTQSAPVTTTSSK